MIFFTNVFTLVGRNPAENKYVDMFWMMFRSLCTTGTFDPIADRFYVMADDDTWAAIQSKWLFDTPFMHHISVPRPTTLLEGIARRYEFLRLAPIHGDPIGLYLDVDIICRRKFRPLFSPDTIAVLPEGGATDPNYCGEGGWARLDHPGFSAGFWAFRVGPSVRALMDEIAASVRREPGAFYTCEQPHFNAAITKKTRAVMFDRSVVSFNGHGMTADTYFINFAGCPGDADFHYQKMAQIAPNPKAGT